MALVGLALASWACAVNPEGAKTISGVPTRIITTGPYRYLRHPMYVGTWLLVVGLGGLAAGWANAFAHGTLAEMLIRDWIGREPSSRQWRRPVPR